MGGQYAASGAVPRRAEAPVAVPSVVCLFDVNIDMHMANLGKCQSAIVSHYGVDSAGTVERTDLER